ncbi:MAG: hypothetical protein OXR66_02190 [Candidatus Woesearchaeota archaeon]|nr:hypothetical protein [Candidatus Woesearchaeota archaeon]
MAKDGWLEQRTRIPFVGIIAIVLIVGTFAVVVHEDDEFSVSGDRNGNADALLRGKASDSFVGVAGIELNKKERMHGVLNTPAYSLQFVVDYYGKLLTLHSNGKTEEVVLTATDDGLAATFERNGQTVRVDVYGAERVLVYKGATTPISVHLADTVQYEGFFLYRSGKYLFQFSPASDRVTITGDERYDVGVANQHGLYVGTWNENGNSHPILVDLAAMRAEAHDVW